MLAFVHSNRKSNVLPETKYRITKTNYPPKNEENNVQSSPVKPEANCIILALT
jgi:hypothetical protein